MKSVISFTHLIVPQFLKQPQSKCIVFIGSGGGIAWMPGSIVYSATKHFITALAETNEVLFLGTTNDFYNGLAIALSQRC